MSLVIENVEVSGWKAAIRGARNPMNSWAKSDSWFIDYWNNEFEEFRCHSLNIESATMNETEQLTDDSHSIMEVMWMVINDKEETEWPTTTIPWPYAEDDNFKYPVQLVLGPNDRKLLMRLCKGGTEESKWRRFVNVSMDITAPLYWWKEFETYKVGTVCNSCSTMHKIQAKEFTLEDFSCEHLCRTSVGYLEETIGVLNFYREVYNSFDAKSSDPNWLKSFVEDYGLKTKKHIWYQMIQLLPSSYNQRRTIGLNYEVLAKQYRERKNHKLQEWLDYCSFIKSLPYSEFITLEDENEK